MSRNKEYKTDNLGLCPYLQLEGLKFLRAELSLGKGDRPVVSFVFEDPLGIGQDLELNFTQSEFKKYRDYFFFFRNEIEKLKRQLEDINRKSQRANDDKYNAERDNKE